MKFEETVTKCPAGNPTPNKNISDLNHKQTRKNTLNSQTRKLLNYKREIRKQGICLTTKEI